MTLGRGNQSAEDQLRDILRNEARTVVPAGDGLAIIRERVARRRRLRFLLVPGGALVTAAAVVAVFALGGTSGKQELNGPAQPGPPVATPTATPTPTVLSPYTGPMLWPFTSVEQGQAWMTDHGRRPWAGVSLEVARHLLTDLLKLDGVTATGDGATIALTVQGERVGVVHLARMFRGGPWTVTGVDGTDLTITAPKPTAAITSPTDVTGRVIGVDENVQLQLVTATGRELATTGAPAGSEVPWQGTLTWTAQDWFTAGIVGVTRSPRDGSINRIAVVVVKRGRS